ncbi:MAG TPA: LCP family protein [Terrimesophilobacter sp.]|nr:LCP family protein [Terrimesophilobacter sp.]
MAASPPSDPVSLGTHPLRKPDTRSREVMRRRAWWLIALNLVVPGSAQIVAGNRALGRVGLLSTLLLWALALAAVITFAVQRELLIDLAANVWVLLAAQVLAAAYAALWIVLTLDTLRLGRLVSLRPAARAGVTLLAVVGLVAAGGVATYGSAVAGSARDAITAIFDDADYVEPIDGRYTIMLLGGDAGPDRLGLRPDSITVASIDAETGAVVLIGVPRNLEQARFSEGSPLWDEFPNGYDCGHDCLISYLYTYAEEHPDLYPHAAAKGSSPGIEATRDAVSGSLGIPIQFAVLIDMEGFSQLIDALGGLTIDVPERTPVGPVTATTPFGYIEAGTQQLDGANALWYARTRFESNDFERMQRQRQVQEAMLRQFEPANVLTRFQAVAAAGAQVVSTDIPRVMLGQFVELGVKSRELPVERVEIVPPEFHSDRPDFEKIAAVIDEAVARSQPSPSPSPAP